MSKIKTIVEGWYDDIYFRGSNNKLIKPSELELGDKILTYSGFNKVVNIVMSYYTEIYLVKVNDILLAKDHPVMLESDSDDEDEIWIRAYELYDEDEEKHPLVKKEKIWLININVENSKNVKIFSTTTIPSGNRRKRSSSLIVGTIANFDKNWRK